MSLRPLRPLPPTHALHAITRTSFSLASRLSRMALPLSRFDSTSTRTFFSRARFAFNNTSHAQRARGRSFFTDSSSDIPGVSSSLVRIPLALGGLAAGGIAYVGTKIEELSQNPALGWLNRGLDSAKDFLKSIDANSKERSERRALEDQERREARERKEAEQRERDEEEARVKAEKDRQREEEEQRKRRHDDEEKAAAAALAAAALREENEMKRREEEAAAEEAKRRSRRHGGAGAASSASGSSLPADEFSDLTRKLIEVRNILKSVDTGSGNAGAGADGDSALHLPSIVVVGSQSSGKSSVLEAIVGREFLPKGTNMVTRRPIELTLIHTPASSSSTSGSPPTEYAEFPQLGLSHITDFAAVARTLADLNAAVPDHEVVSSTPIELRIHSPRVPDLTLVDLPGYIAVTTRRQPAELKARIAELCERYIERDNVILAVSSADVDLANSEALRASRRADPMGVRTIGVLTKMDLVEPSYAASLLRNQDYALHLGYVGVVCKAPGGGSKGVQPRGDDAASSGAGSGTSQALATRAPAPPAPSAGGAVVVANDDYFRQHPSFSARDLSVGVASLRRKLVSVLEQVMSSSLTTVADAVERELEETNYAFKVQYDDRRVSAESYAADAVDGVKQRFKAFVAAFGKQEVREAVRKALQRRVLDVCAQVYYAEPGVTTEFPRGCVDEPLWTAKVDLGASALTKSGVGRLTTQLVVDTLQRTVEDITSQEPFVYHPEARKKILDFAAGLVRSKFHATVDQVENNIKPYKFEVDVNQSEWSDAAGRAVATLEDQLKEKTAMLQSIKSQVGRRRLRMAMTHLENQARQERARVEAARRQREAGGSAALAPAAVAPAEPSWWQRMLGGAGSVPKPTERHADASPRINTLLLEKAREALSLRQQTVILKSRIQFLRSGACRSTDAKTCCPEVFYTAIAEKLAASAAMFLQVELLTDFFFQFPREVDNRLYYDLSKDEIQDFAKQNPQIRRHLELQEKKEKLEEAMEKLIEIQKKAFDRSSRY
ncbi:hypothetical protein M427DRAFT_114311 [Gonapodya prolifera JEL478]|uniref:dynamin GTPase n=1 Tax=Gonapodya prolifera (strain JEL478) TaxID=1344416 RepID=A0A139A5Y9_GONPJ|nr:hypothetical protein M427DRAFT_114311 [Gonapodya prolifera JEL478]|eukprot:KXS12078.1 hypothetical protein M427DRAFT_114311 [Gonapodya prolifera JEL478]